VDSQKTAVSAGPLDAPIS